jgi:hypothetical protein
MLRALDGDRMAIFKAAVHIAAALVIMWCFYRVANGHLSLL